MSCVLTEDRKHSAAVSLRGGCRSKADLMHIQVDDHDLLHPSPRGFAQFAGGQNQIRVHAPPFPCRQRPASELQLRAGTSCSLTIVSAGMMHASPQVD